ncbi:2-phosphosulfolactate phosphatase [Rummeliibacillus sp. JY-2-4R]
MRKIHVITQKESVNENQLNNCTAVVIDVFLATSTIAFLLNKNYHPIYAVMDQNSALAVAKVQKGPYLLLGETKGDCIPGFHYPDPSRILPCENQQAAIICSTNGTKAIQKAKNAKKLYISSLINGHAIAGKLYDQTDDSSILLICSGNDNRFSLEDFVGAGQIIDYLMSKGDYALSDSSKLARETYQRLKAENFQKLYDCETALLLRSLRFEESLTYVINHFESIHVVPVYDGEKIIIETKA